MWPSGIQSLTRIFLCLFFVNFAEWSLPSCTEITHDIMGKASIARRTNLVIAVSFPIWKGYARTLVRRRGIFLSFV